MQISMPECEVHVREPDSIYPDIVLQTQSPEDSQARTLVSELMIMANEAVATIGAQWHPVLLLVKNKSVVPASRDEEVSHSCQHRKGAWLLQALYAE